jgi:Ca2+-transporting ATPase
MQTEIGHIAAMLDGGSRLKTPLQQRLQRFGKRLTGLILLICAVLFVVGLLRGEPAVLMFMTAVSLAVAAIPEALPAVVTIALALGARRMVHQQVLIRRLPAVETLGSVTYICSDKTGTLTKNAMRVAAFQLGDAMYELEQPPQHQQSALFLEAMALNNDAFSQGHGEVQGEPTETALYEALQTLQLDPVTMRRQKPRLAEIPFDSTRRMMTTFHAHDGAVIAYTKGAPEHVIPACRQQLLNDSEIALDQADMLARAEQLAGEGYRVLAIACRQWPQLPDDLDSEQIEHELVLLGLVALMDPPREEVAEAIETCRSAGIVPVMITGDHPTTAMAIARRIGLIESQEQRLLTGRDIEQLSDQALRDIVADTRVYARVAPEQKIRIVEALQQRGEYVAMTGDGVNDAPALRRANIGVAMGKVGTDVAREAADMVLLDDHFASIVNAVREGRRIFDNIRKFVRYTMSSNAGEIITLSLAPLFGMPLPLLPIHILWINLVTDGLPGLALSLEKQEPNIMQRPPRDPHESIMSGGMGWQIVWIGCLIGGLSLTAQAWALGDDSAHWQTMVFTVLTFSQLFNALAIRSERRSIFSQSLFDNSAMLGSVLLTFALQLVLIYTPLFQEVFRLQPLDLHELLVCIGLSALVLPAVELEKWLTRRGLLYRSANNSKARK